LANIGNVLRSLKDHPGYTLMRSLARFPVARAAVANSRRALQGRRTAQFLVDCESRMTASAFASVDRQAFVQELERNALAFGLTLPPKTVQGVLHYAASAPCYADRMPTKGFMAAAHREAEKTLGKAILVAQYYNTTEDCPAIRALIDDPALQWIACRYLGSTPTFVGANLWWTFAADASEEDRDNHAHLYHRDVDDFRFFKFFFYMTDVDSDGAHICVSRSHLSPLIAQPGDYWNIRRYTDAEVERNYSREDIIEISGPAGTGFAENTLCIHKGSTPRATPRLLLQLQYALFDYGAMNDRIDRNRLRPIAA
jgi:hypothetical protein